MLSHLSSLAEGTCFLVYVFTWVIFSDGDKYTLFVLFVQCYFQFPVGISMISTQ